MLAYLNLAEKLNCLYCSYANGFAACLREIGARTEQYWCPIKHAQRLLHTHARYSEFVDYGDARGYRRGQGLAGKIEHAAVATLAQTEINCRNWIPANTCGNDG